MPEELATQIELWDGRVVWVRRGPFEHQQYTGTFWSALRRNASDDMTRRTGHCWHNTKTDIEAKKIRYAGSGIPWYWEVHLARNPRRIATVRAYVLETAPGQIHEGVRPLHQTNYLLADEWTPAGTTAIEIEHPFPISIPWAELEF
ncbi:Uma2 family endonuclease [Nocardia sp. NPDC058499]|uniref:Uma2 family endonuclease n=1 Tax=Nocardia sp. NPDC058499 TaxID=3346530 RepID=UPI003653AB75